MISEHLQNIKGLIIDMDGVLWHDTQPIGDLPAIFEQIHVTGLKVILATNNATRTVGEYLKKLKDFGVKLAAWQVITSAQALAILLNQKFPQGATIYVVGQPSLKRTLTEQGFIMVSEKEECADIVVTSMDYALTYAKLKHATLLIRKGSLFFSTNADTTLPTPEGLVPGSGSILVALEAASGRKAEVIGKPQPDIYKIALQRLRLKPEETLAIGDRLETDIAGAQVAGIRTALVLSGVSTQEQAQKYFPKPDIVAKDLTELIF
ncbi:MAG: HAD-IIA family hydrolase [Chloroflexi bacterium]|nr:HAD-IIA family hydrolase [Chloroflexota bacterium]